MRALLAQSPIAALAAVCIAVPAGTPAANVASASPDHKGITYTLAAKSSEATNTAPDLKLVLAPTGTDAGVGSGVAGGSPTKLELLALPDSVAASVTANGTGSVPSTFIAAGRTAAADIISDLNKTAAAAVTASPTLLDVLQLPLQTLWAIGAGVDIPPTLDPKTYTSLLTVTSNAIQVAILPLTVINLALYGQAQKIPDTITKTLNTAATSLFQGLPASIAATLQYDVNVLQQFFGGLGATGATATAASSLAVSPAAVVAATPTLLDVLQLPLQTAWSIGAGVNVPSSPLIPKPYTSLLTVTSNAIQVGLLPLTVLNLALYGQIQKIPDTITTTISTAVSSLLQGLPASIAGTLAYDVDVLQQFFGGLGAMMATPNGATTTAAALSASPSVAVATTPTLLDVLQLPLQTIWAIGAGVNVPKSELIPTPYTSLITATSSVIQVGLLPLTVLNLALYGQIQKIPDTITTTLATAVKTVFQDLPASIAGTLAYDVNVVQQFLGSLNPVPNAVAARTSDSLQTKVTTLAAPSDPQADAKTGDTTGTSGGDKGTATTSAATTSGDKTKTDDTTPTGSTATTATGSSGETKTGTATGDTKTGSSGDTKTGSTSGSTTGTTTGTPTGGTTSGTTGTTSGTSGTTGTTGTTKTGTTGDNKTGTTSGGAADGATSGSHTTGSESGTSGTAN